MISRGIALAFCILLSSGSEPVDVGRCPDHDCKGRGWFWWSGEDCHPPGNVECPAGTGTGRETIPAERLLLDAAPRKLGPLEAYGERPVFNGIEDGGTTARNLLLMRADKLQAAADPLGNLLAWALRLWTGKPVDCGPCLLCEQRAKQDAHARSLHGRMEWITTCPACSGSGRQLGHPHTAEAVAWLDPAYSCTRGCERRSRRRAPLSRCVHA